MSFLIIVSLAFVGHVLGSFSTALIYRVPRNIPWAFSSKNKTSGQGGEGQGDVSAYHSICPQCSHQLGARDLVPVFSWVFSKGCCRYCRAKIPVTYLAVELVSLLCVFGIYFVKGVTPEAVFIVLALPFLLALFVIDVRHLILPNILVGILASIGALKIFYLMIYGYGYSIEFVAQEYMAGAVIYGACVWGVGFIMTRILKKPAMGFGDVKFFAASGLWLGLSNLPFFFFLAGVYGVAFGYGWRVVKGEPVFPFGPALILSFVTLLLFQEHVRIVFGF
jgi:prepilin signal peptidase PulO-like enzyme (type II secretory pathway)